MNAKIEGCIAQIKYREDEIAKLKDEITYFENDMITECPVKVGDTVTANGTQAGKQIVVDHIQIYTSFNIIDGKGCDVPVGFRCIGKIIKKDGTLGLVDGSYKILFKDLPA